MGDATIHVDMFFAKSEVIQEREVLIYDFYDMVGDVGGYLGLLLGVSLLSIYEVIVNFGMKYCCGISTKNKSNNKKNKANYSSTVVARKVPYPPRKRERKKGVSLVKAPDVKGDHFTSNRSDTP